MRDQTASRSVVWQVALGAALLSMSACSQPAPSSPVAATSAAEGEEEEGNLELLAEFAHCLAQAGVIAGGGTVLEFLAEAPDAVKMLHCMEEKIPEDGW